MKLVRLDHLVLTVRNVAATAAFYQKVLGLEAIRSEDGRTSLLFGEQKINLHEHGREIVPHAHRPTPGSADLCFVAAGTIGEAQEHLRLCQVAVEAGPVRRTGAGGPIQSLYVRDPDRNLVEIAVAV